MLRLKNHDEVYEALVEQLKEFAITKNKYQTDIYLYVKDGNGTVYTFTNVGGNSWLNDDHTTIYSDKEHCETIMDDLVDGASYGWLIEELESIYNLSGLKDKAYKDITAAIDSDILDEDEIACFDDLEAYDVECWLKKNYSEEIKKYYEEYFIESDAYAEGFSEQANYALDEFENNNSFVVLNDGVLYSEYSDYDEAAEEVKELGSDGEIDIWSDYHLREVKSSL